jgi:hypothetical protein
MRSALLETYPRATSRIAIFVPGLMSTEGAKVAKQLAKKSLP